MELLRFFTICELLKGSILFLKKLLINDVFDSIVENTSHNNAKNVMQKTSFQYKELKRM